MGESSNGKCSPFQCSSTLNGYTGRGHHTEPETILIVVLEDLPPALKALFHQAWKGRAKTDSSYKRWKAETEACLKSSRKEEGRVTPVLLCTAPPWAAMGGRGVKK
ncbi:uncharacterized protein LOC144326184 [Podarcis muralis]